MEDFEVAPQDSFKPDVALERMLRLLSSLFDEVAEHKRSLIMSPDHDVISYHLEEAFTPALQVAREDIQRLIDDLKTLDFTLEEKKHLRLDGPVMRFRMLAIKLALEEALGVHPLRGYSTRRGWALYKRALETLFALIEEPLACLTDVLDGPRGPVEFKSTLTALMEMKSTAAA